MFFLGTPIQQDERGRCTLLSPRTFPIQTVELQPFDQRILVRTLTHSLPQALMSGRRRMKKDSRDIRAGAWPMSGVYWGIVTGLLAMVVMLFACIDILYGAEKRSSTALGDGIDESNETAGSTSTGSRQAA